MNNRSVKEKDGVKMESLTGGQDTTMPRKQPKSIRTTLTLPEGLWERIKEIGKSSHPEIPASQVVVLLLEHAVKEYQLVISVDIQKLHK